MRSRLTHLSRRERQIMDVLYRMGRATVAEVRAGLPDPPSYSAVRAILRILEQKGHVRHRHDAARYVFTVGFLTLLIVGMSFRILPVFSGKTLWSSKLAFATYALILGGVAMRLLQYPAAFRAKLYEAGSWMGVLVVAALILFTVNLVKTMRAKLAPR